jgi:hypothetical protein
VTPAYIEHDRILIPQDIPELGVSRGDAGLVKDLTLDNEIVTASVRVDYSTGQPRGWVEMTVKPEERMVSYSPA